MNPDDAVTLQMRNRLTTGPVRVRHDWSVLEAEYMAMVPPKPYDFSLHSGRHYLTLLNIHRRDGETFADEHPRSTLRDTRGKLVFIPAGCRLQGWVQPGTKPVAFTGASLARPLAHGSARASASSTRCCISSTPCWPS